MPPSKEYPDCIFAELLDSSNITPDYRSKGKCLASKINSQMPGCCFRTALQLIKLGKIQEVKVIQSGLTEVAVADRAQNQGITLAFKKLNIS